MPAKSRSTGPFVAPVTKLSYAPNQVFTDEEFLWENQPQTTFATNIPVWTLGTKIVENITRTTNTTWTSGTAWAVPIALQQGMVVTNISYRTGTAGAVTPTAQFVALYDNATTPNLLVTSGNLTTTARAASTTYTVAMQRPYTVPTSNIYYVSISFTAGTMPDMTGFSPGVVPATNIHYDGILGTPRQGIYHGSALAGVAPATIASPTVASKAYWVAVQ
jgi:hypothetical protein